MPVAMRRDAHHLQAVRMAANMMHADAVGDLGVAAVERDPVGINGAHHAHDILYLESVTHARVTHVAPGRKAHLAVLQMKARTREEIEIAGLIVVQVRDDHVLDAGGVDADPRQGEVDRRPQVAGALACSFCRESVSMTMDQSLARATQTK
jgi:hypothetical protein